MRLITVLAMLLMFSCLANAKIISNVEIPTNYLVVNPGGEFYANLKLYNVDGGGRKDYYVEAYIINENNIRVMEKTKEIAVEDEVSVTFNFDIPDEYIK